MAIVPLRSGWGLVHPAIGDGNDDCSGVRKDKRGRGAAGKVAVFGIQKRGGKVFTKVALDTRSDMLMPVVQRQIVPDSIMYTESCRSYNARGFSGFYHERINHSVEFSSSKNHVNGIENFCNRAKRVLRKYNVIPK